MFPPPTADPHPRRFDFAHRGWSIPLSLPASADALIDEEAFHRDERLPYWADLWPSGVALARHLIDQPPAPGDGAPHLLELGCGVGLVSIAAACAGWDVTATDYEPEALEWTRANWAGVLERRVAQAERGRERSPAGTLRTAHLDWRSPPGAVQADVVVAADIFYEERAVRPLAEALPRLLAPGGRTILADPGRRWLEPFLERLRGEGWTVAASTTRRERGTAPGARESGVRIVELRPPAGARAADGSPSPPAVP